MRLFWQDAAGRKGEFDRGLPETWRITEGRGGGVFGGDGKERKI